jgi:hypothetical protein
MTLRHGGASRVPVAEPPSGLRRNRRLPRSGSADCAAWKTLPSWAVVGTEPGAIHPDTATQGHRLSKPWCVARAARIEPR